MRGIQHIISVLPQPGTGILRPFPSSRLPHLDPFVFLDTAAPVSMKGRRIYVGPHPHRGVQPVSLLFRGKITHRDSLGNIATIESGGMQWLKAGSGALHEEVLESDATGIFHMAQLWVNTPAAQKMDPPEHSTLQPEQVPSIIIPEQNARLKLYAGEFGAHQGPTPSATPVLILHIQLENMGRVSIPVPKKWNAGLTVLDGKISTDTTTLSIGDTAVFKNESADIVVSSREGGECLIMAGQPIEEPISIGGGFVMNSRTEIEQAFDDYRSGKMGTLTARGGAADISHFELEGV